MNVHDFLFGPLDKDWCMHFHLFSIFWYILFLISVFMLIRYLLGKNVNGNSVFGMIVVTLIFMVMYFEKRILHGMCINSLS